ncbi:hypothetical protein [Streptomyces sp. NPDC047046]|uniref:hypothetical protein n=1 Tax=Streptomyces sp. NPDC047046 TaxID=3155378 RepID=UPI00340B7185
MNTPQRTRRLRSAQAIHGARKARAHMRRDRIARNLDQIAPGVATVRTVPITTHHAGAPRTRLWVLLDDALGLPIRGERTAHRDAVAVLRAAFPAAQWTTYPYRYDAVAGCLALDAPTMPEELHG